MRPRASTASNLSPFAPEYYRIPCGVAPSPDAPLPSFFPSPPPAPCRPPSSSPYHQPSLLLPHQILRYPPSTAHNTQQFYPTSTYSTYYVTPLDQVPAAPPPPAVVVRCGQVGRGFTRRGRGSGRGRGRGRGRESFWSERSEKIRNFNCATSFRTSEKNCVGFPRGEQFSKRGIQMQREENRHKIMPLNRNEDNTTVMIKNIPYDCPRKTLMKMLDNFCFLANENACTNCTSGEDAKLYAYDFLYLPIDFRTKKSRGFAFVNFTTSRAVWKFYDSFHLTKWDFVDRLKWPKKIEIVAAKIQGKDEQVKHFLESYFECESDDFLPVCFSPARDGSGQPVELTVVGNRRAAARWESRRNHKP